MRIIAKSLLIIFFVIFFLLEILAIAFKFQLLDYNFWQTTFQKHNVYQNLALASKTSFESQVTKEGGNNNDVKILTDLITPDNAKEVVDKNLGNFLSFANGVSTQIYVYLPIDKIPSNLLPKSISGIQSEMTLQDILTKFNFQDWQNLPLATIAQLGKYASYSFYIVSGGLVLLTVFLFLLIESEKRLISIGIAFILSGGLTLILTQASTALQTNISDILVNKTSLVSLVMGVVIPPVLIELTATWKVVGILMIIAGAALSFIKKPGYNTSR